MQMHGWLRAGSIYTVDHILHTEGKQAPTSHIDSLPRRTGFLKLRASQWKPVITLISSKYPVCKWGPVPFTILLTVFSHCEVHLHSEEPETKFRSWWGGQAVPMSPPYPPCVHVRMCALMSMCAHACMLLAVLLRHFKGHCWHVHPPPFLLSPSFLSLLP